MKNFRIDFENEIWDLLLNDPVYQEHAKHINESIFEPFEDRYNYSKNKFKEVTTVTKEAVLIKDLFEKYDIDKSFIIFEGNAVRGIHQSWCNIFEGKVIFTNSKLLTEVFLDTELSIIFAHECGHIVNKCPLPVPPLDYFLDLIHHPDTKEKEQAKYLRMQLISSFLCQIVEINADRFSILENGSFERYYTAMSKLFRINFSSTKFKDHNIVKFFTEFPKKHKREIDLSALNQGYPSIDVRIYLAYLFCRENNIIESKSLKKIPFDISTRDILKYDDFFRIYNKLKTAT